MPKRQGQITKISIKKEGIKFEGIDIEGAMEQDENEVKPGDKSHDLLHGGSQFNNTEGKINESELQKSSDDTLENFLHSTWSPSKKRPSRQDFDENTEEVLDASEMRNTQIN